MNDQTQILKEIKKILVEQKESNLNKDPWNMKSDDKYDAKKLSADNSSFEDGVRYIELNTVDEANKFFKEYAYYNFNNAVKSVILANIEGGVNITMVLMGHNNASSGYRQGHFYAKFPGSTLWQGYGPGYDGISSPHFPTPYKLTPTSAAEAEKEKAENKAKEAIMRLEQQKTQVFANNSQVRCPCSPGRVSISHSVYNDLTKRKQICINHSFADGKLTSLTDDPIRTLMGYSKSSYSLDIMDLEQKARAVISAHINQGIDCIGKIGPVKTISKDYSDSWSGDTWADILEIGLFFIPGVGPFLSAGVGLLHAYSYYKRNEKKTAGLYVIFAVLPLGGPVAKSVMKSTRYSNVAKLVNGTTSLDSKAYERVAKMVETGQQVSSATKTEINAARDIRTMMKNDPDLIQKLYKEAGSDVKLKDLDVKKLYNEKPIDPNALNVQKQIITKYPTETALVIGAEAGLTVGGAIGYTQAYDAHLSPWETVTSDKDWMKNYGTPNKYGEFSSAEKKKAWEDAKAAFFSDGSATDNNKLKDAWNDDIFISMAGKQGAQEGWRPGKIGWDIDPTDKLEDIFNVEGEWEDYQTDLYKKAKADHIAALEVYGEWNMMDKKKKEDILNDIEDMLK